MLCAYTIYHIEKSNWNVLQKKDNRYVTESYHMLFPDWTIPIKWSKISDFIALFVVHFVNHQGSWTSA